MVLGSIWCPQEKIKEINSRIKEIKNKNSISKTTELKWTKISPSGLEAYEDLINYFFDDDDLHFRALVIPDKGKLNHTRFNQTHDEWYYKMYFDMLKVIFNPYDNYEVYIDIKDNQSYTKSQQLREVCCNSMYDFSRKVIKRLQPVRSDEIGLMQIVDLLVGAVGYENRIFPDNFSKSTAKQKLINLIKKRSRYTMTKTTLLREDKFNLFFWDARDTI